MTTTNKWAKSTLKPPSNLSFSVQNTFRKILYQICLFFLKVWESKQQGRTGLQREKPSTIFHPIPPSFLKAVPQDIRRPGSLRFCSQDPKMFLWQTALEINVIFPKKQFYFRHISGTLWAKLAMAWQLGNLTLIYTTFSL